MPVATFVLAATAMAASHSTPPQGPDDDSLAKQLWSKLIAETPEETKEREKVLVEVLRRGGDGWRRRLVALLPAVKERAAEEGFRDESLELHLLTALRRLQGREDPLTVEARMMTEGPFVFPDLPVVGVRLLYAEGETETFLSRIGGDYRGGRLGRWDLVLEELDGTPHVGVDDWTSFMGGGISRLRRVGPGFVWGAESPADIRGVRRPDDEELAPEDTVKPVPLRMMDYQRPAKLGSFSVRAAYHATEAIADLDGHGNRIVHLSEAQSFRWEPRVIELTEADERRVRSLVNLYLESETVALTHFHLPGYRGSNKPDAHPLDRLFAEGWAAVPFMIDALVMESTPHERALLIAGLFSLTGMESPTGFRSRGAVGEHTIHGTRVPEGSGVFSTPAKGSSKGKLRPEAQGPFAARWEQHGKHIRVQRVKVR